MTITRVVASPALGPKIANSPAQAARSEYSNRLGNCCSIHLSYGDVGARIETASTRDKHRAGGEIRAAQDVESVTFNGGGRGQDAPKLPFL
jgi:hypothetical protein